MRTDYGFEYEDEQLEERSTKELVEELVSHGKRLIEIEVRSLRGQLEGELGRVKDDARANGNTMMQEARERMTENLAAVRADLAEHGRRAKAAVGTLSVGGVLAHAAVFLLLAALVLGLATMMPLWAAALIVGVVMAAIGGGMLAAGAKKARGVGKNALPRTNHQLKESKRWLERSKEIVAGTIRDLKSTLSGIEWPKLRQSSAAGQIRTTSATRLEPPSSARPLT
jgi:hypothetical protein